MDFDTAVKIAIYQASAESGTVPSAEDVADRIGAAPGEVRTAFGRLQDRRVLLLDTDGRTIRMAPPFSGVPTQHHVKVDGTLYYANCAWDALGIPAALHRPGVVSSRCGQSQAPLELEVGPDGPPSSPWLFHSLVPARKWWDDLVFT